MNPAKESSTVVAGGIILEARDLKLSFGETPALRGANLSVHRGEVVAIMGPSGSGKSTLLHCLAGILVPDAGRVDFDGRRLDTLREAERSKVRRDRFGFVFQFGQLVPELTAEENVALPLLLGGIRREEALRRARSWFGPTGSLDSLSGELVMDLLIHAARELGSTVILVTHEPRVAAYADREVIVRDGAVVTPAPAMAR
jgi:putative ABC transport system ATP-binding protein